VNCDCALHCGDVTAIRLVFPMFTSGTTSPLACIRASSVFFFIVKHKRAMWRPTHSVHTKVRIRVCVCVCVCVCEARRWNFLSGRFKALWIASIGAESFPGFLSHSMQNTGTYENLPRLFPYSHLLALYSRLLHISYSTQIYQSPTQWKYLVFLTVLTKMNS
jgi:hypothetical protein